MAPRKPAAAGKAKEPPDVSKGSVVKRPARGYHKFKNGMLNVKPKGDEKALVSTNQSSPLLRLPAELRNKIWEYALGGMEFRKVLGKGSFRAIPRERKNVFALLEVCRQVYSESAQLSWAVNSFSIRFGPTFSRSIFGSFQKYQINQIQELRIYLSMDWVIDGSQVFLARMFERLNFNLLPELRRIRFRLFPYSKNTWAHPSLAECESIVRLVVESMPEWSSYNLGFEKMEMSECESVKNSDYLT